MSVESPDKKTKSPHAEREERILSMWKEKDIFNKTLEQTKKGKEFIFYEGPPTANGRPGIHHLEARAFKDAIPRYKTMQGFHVRRKGGWDTHGLPVELQVEKELGLKSKKEIESYGIGAFNEKCKESVWKYVHEWEDFTNRMGYWVDLKNPYITYKPQYIESVWNIIKTVDDKKLLYKDYKVVPWCPRCGTGLSSHELAQGYEEVKDLTLYVKFKIERKKEKGKSENQKEEVGSEGNVYFLAWTTTPWTLPGNVALAVGKDIEYVEVKVKGKKGEGKNENVGGNIILAKERLATVLNSYEYEVVKTFKGSDLIGISYEPLFPFLKDNLSTTEKEKIGNAFKVYVGDFVTTTDGTGIVHIAPMYGQDDFELGTKNNLPKHHLVNDDGTFKKECGFLAGRFVKEKDEKGKPTLDVDIVEDLKKKNFFFAQENYKHTYPHCWRCHTPLIYFARDSWYIQMSSLRDQLIKENESIHWEPAHIKDGRFGEWLREVKDWAISRERYWGTPLPLWSCDTCHARKVVGSVEELKKPAKNTYYVVRHGEASSNIEGVLSSDATAPVHLTPHGIEEVQKTARSLKKIGFDLMYVSPFVRTRETADIIKKELGFTDAQVIIDDRLIELQTGSWNGKKVSDFIAHAPLEKRYDSSPDGIESCVDVKKRLSNFLHDMESKHEGKKILIVSHGTPSEIFIAIAQYMSREETISYERQHFFGNAEERPLNYSLLPHNSEYELDLHRPFIDEVTFACACGGTMKRAKEVMDVWFDSGAMPFAQDHQIKNQDPRSKIQDTLSRLLQKKEQIAYPADFISEAIDQTRGWFYTLHAIGTLMGKGRAYKNVICLGHILDAEGKKMSKSVGNVVNPWDMMDLYGADALRFWMYSVNQPGDSKNFDQKTVDEVIKKVFNLVSNVTSFYKMYEDKSQISNTKSQIKSQNVLDQWIVARINEVVGTVTQGLDNYVFFESARVIRDFIGDLSQWYIRRSRDRFKGDDEMDKQSALATTRYVLTTLAKVMAPFTPFFAEYIYAEVGGLPAQAGEKESVHLETWPTTEPVDTKLITDMTTVRSLASKGLEARMKAKINVRQPLRVLNVKQFMTLNKQLVELIKDEVNVKEVAFGLNIETDVSLDTNITPELKEEGEYRELVRMIQDLRKEKGLSVGDKVKITIPEVHRPIAVKYIAELKKVTGVTEIAYGDSFDL
ncbi:MAG: class I tRNA ligase family protein [Candidatus Taylorbacteria bacterium]